MAPLRRHDDVRTTKQHEELMLREKLPRMDLDSLLMMYINKRYDS